nr:hypothetical protein [Caulobacter mirabilis]
MKTDAKNRKVEAALSYVQQFNGEPMSNHWQNLESIWAGQQSALIATNQSDGLTRSNIDRLVNFLIARHDEKPGVTPARASIRQSTQFFDHMLICSRKAICDVEVIEEYFGPTICEFWRNYQTVIIEMRKAGTIGLGVEIERHERCKP